MKTICLTLIRWYQRGLSPLTGSSCRFYPSCSEYMHRAITIHGVLYGIWLGITRLMRCHPFSNGGIDHVPNRKDLLL